MSVRERLQGIYDLHGYLTPELVVEIAEDEDDPLHDRFEWDDTVAGPAYRRAQAGQLIRSVTVSYRKASGSEGTVRAFHSVRREKGFAYVPADQVANDPFLSRLVLADMEREWRQFKRRYEEFNEFWVMVRRDTEEAA